MMYYNTKLIQRTLSIGGYQDDFSIVRNLKYQIISFTASYFVFSFNLDSPNLLVQCWLPAFKTERMNYIYRVLGLAHRKLIELRICAGRKYRSVIILMRASRRSRISSRWSRSCFGFSWIATLVLAVILGRKPCRPSETRVTPYG